MGEPLRESHDETAETVAPVAEAGTEPHEGGEPATPADDESAADAATTDEYNERPDSDVLEDDDEAVGGESGPDEPDADETAEMARRVQTERALAKRDQQLDRENERHAKRVAEIMEAGAADLIPCPVCMDGIAGWIYPPDVQQLSEDAIARVRQVIGLPDYSTFLPAPDAQVCPECAGLGEVTTGSHVPGYEVKTCRRCMKQGWVSTGAASPPANVNLETGEIVTGPTTIVAETADPEVQNLRARGFTVIPPMPVAPA